MKNVLATIAITGICASQAFNIDQAADRYSQVEAAFNASFIQLSSHGSWASSRRPPGPSFSAASLGGPADAESFYRSFNSLVTSSLGLISTLSSNFQSAPFGLTHLSSVMSRFLDSRSMCSRLAVSSESKTWLNQTPLLLSDVMPASRDLSAALLTAQLATLWAVADNHCGIDTSWYESIWQQFISTLSAPQSGNLCLSAHVSALVSRLQTGDTALPDLADCIPPPATPLSLPLLNPDLPMPSQLGALIPGSDVSFRVEKAELPGIHVGYRPKKVLPTLSECQAGYVKSGTSFVPAPVGHWSDASCVTSLCPGHDISETIRIVYNTTGLRSVEECLATYECRKLRMPDGVGGCVPLPSMHFFDYRTRTLRLISPPEYPVDVVSYSDLDYQVPTAGVMQFDLPSFGSSYSVSFNCVLDSPLNGLSGLSMFFGSFPDFFVGVSGEGRFVVNVGGRLVTGDAIDWEVGRYYGLRVVISGGVFLFRDGQLVGRDFGEVGVSGLSGGVHVGNYKSRDHPLYEEVTPLAFSVRDLQFYSGAFFPPLTAPVTALPQAISTTRAPTPVNTPAPTQVRTSPTTPARTPQPTIAPWSPPEVGEVTTEDSFEAVTTGDGLITYLIPLIIVCLVMVLLVYAGLGGRSGSAKVESLDKSDLELIEDWRHLTGLRDSSPV